MLDGVYVVRAQGSRPATNWPRRDEERRMNIPAVRDFARLPCRLDAVLEFGHGRRQLDATVRDISINGAKLEGCGVELSPQEFDVVITLETGEIDRRPARVVWRGRSTLGVFFTDGRTTLHGVHPEDFDRASNAVTSRPRASTIPL
jgi:hypothetical protein